MGFHEIHGKIWNWSSMGLGTSSWKDTLILTMYLLLVLYVGLRVWLAKGMGGAGTWGGFDPSPPILDPHLASWRLLSYSPERRLLHPLPSYSLTFQPGISDTSLTHTHIQRPLNPQIIKRIKCAYTHCLEPKVSLL